MPNDIVVRSDKNGGKVHLSADRVYDLNEDKTQDVLNDEFKTALNSLESGLAIIVNGDTCTTAVPVNGYAYIKNNTHGLSEGLYKNTSASAFPTSGSTADSTVFTAISGGALNSLRLKFVNNSTPTKIFTTGRNIFYLGTDIDYPSTTDGYTYRIIGARAGTTANVVLQGWDSQIISFYNESTSAQSAEIGLSWLGIPQN